MKAAIVIIGIGEIGSIFARGFLKIGHLVYPNYARYGY
jgi:prephenate dehydrogenase